MLKLFFFLGALVPVVQKTFNIFNIFNISAVSSPFFFNIRNLELTFLTFLQFRAFFSENKLETAEMLRDLHSEEDIKPTDIVFCKKYSEKRGQRGVRVLRVIKLGEEKGVAKPLFS